MFDKHTRGLVWPMDISVNKVDDVAIIDNNLNQILVYNKDGHLVRTYGKKGKGPGELLSSYNIHIDENGDIFTAEFTNHRLQIFRHDGGTETLALELPGQIMDLARDSHRDFTYVLTRYSEYYLHQIDSTGTVRSFNKQEQYLASKNWIERVVNNSARITTNRAGEILFAFEYRPLIKRFRSDRMLVSVIHYLPLYKLLHTFTEGGHAGHHSLELSTTCHDIATDDAGNLYLLSRTEREGGQNVILSFDKEGRFVQRIFLPDHTYRALAISPNYLYLLVDGSQEAARCDQFPMSLIDQD